MFGSTVTLQALIAWKTEKPGHTCVDVVVEIQHLVMEAIMEVKRWKNTWKRMGKLSGSHFKCQLNDLDIIEDSSFDATVHDSKKSPFFSHAHYVLARSGHHKIGCSFAA